MVETLLPMECLLVISCFGFKPGEAATERPLGGGCFFTISLMNAGGTHHLHGPLKQVPLLVSAGQRVQLQISSGGYGSIRTIRKRWITETAPLDAGRVQIEVANGVRALLVLNRMCVVG